MATGKHLIPELIVSDTAFDQALAALRAASSISIDIESNGFHNYNERTCILSASTSEQDFIFDSLELWERMGELAELFSEPKRRVLCHGGSYDVSSLKRDFAYRFENLVDTMLAADLLGHEQLGLANLAKRYLGVELAKEHQRHNWSLRPLHDEHLRYLVGDTRHLFELFENLLAELEAKDLIDEYEIECRQLAESPAGLKPGSDPEAFRKLKECRYLTAEQRGVLRELYLLRERISAERDLAPFRVLTNQVLLALVRKHNPTVGDIEGLAGFPRALARTHGEHFVHAIASGKATPLPDKPYRNEAREPLPRHKLSVHAQKELVRDLKHWRTREAQERGIGVQGVLPTAVLNAMVRLLPATHEEISALPRMGQRRSQRYAEELAVIVRRYR